MSSSLPRTLFEAVERAHGTQTTGFRFLDEQGRDEEFLSHGEIAARSDRIGGALQAFGAKPGDRVAIILPSDQDFVCTFLGAIRAGLVPVPMYPPFGLARLSSYLENAAHIVRKSCARFIVTSPEIRRVLGTLREQAPELESIETVAGLRRIGHVLSPVQIDLNDTCFLQFTSGSVAQPKGVIVTHANLEANVRSLMEHGLQTISEENVGVSWLPFYHDMGLIGFVISPLFYQRNVVFLSPVAFLKRPIRWLEAITKYRATVSFAPNFAYALCVKRIAVGEMDGLDLSAWHSAGCAAERIRVEDVAAFVEKFGPVGFRKEAIRCAYGLAESTLAVSIAPVNRGLLIDTVSTRELNAGRATAPTVAGEETTSVVSCGPGFPNHEIGIFSVDDHASARPLGEREVGEVRLRGPSMTSGYFGAPELSRDLRAGSWLKTGDLGYLHQNQLYICGRLKELIIVNGRNYYPQDFEWEALKTAGVRKGNIAAFGTSDAEHPERVVVVFETAIEGKAERLALEGDVREAIHQALGVTVETVAVNAGVLPKTSSGKLQRTKTRELYENGELCSRPSAREVRKTEVAAVMIKSQWAYLKHAFSNEG